MSVVGSTCHLEDRFGMDSPKPPYYWNVIGWLVDDPNRV